MIMPVRQNVSVVWTSLQETSISCVRGCKNVSGRISFPRRRALLHLIRLVVLASAMKSCSPHQLRLCFIRDRHDERLAFYLQSRFVRPIHVLVPRLPTDGHVDVQPGLKGSIAEGPNHSNFSDWSSVRILGIERKPRKTTSSK